MVIFLIREYCFKKHENLITVEISTIPPPPELNTVLQTESAKISPNEKFLNSTLLLGKFQVIITGSCNLRVVEKISSNLALNTFSYSISPAHLVRRTK